MKQVRKSLAFLLIVTGLAFTSCNDDDSKMVEKTNAKVVEIKTTAEGAQDDPTQQTGKFVKFSFKEGKEVTTDDWDFAVRGRLFITNGRKYKEESQPNIFGDTEPSRTKKVAVTTIIGEFQDVTTIGGFVKSDWHQDYDYAKGYRYEATAPAISFESNVYNTSNSRETWHLRANKDKLILRPVVFVFKTQDEHIAKMVIEKMKRTNTDFEEKEDIVYTIKYYYNTEANSPSLDEKK